MHFLGGASKRLTELNAEIDEAEANPQPVIPLEGRTTFRNTGARKLAKLERERKMLTAQTNDLLGRYKTSDAAGVAGDSAPGPDLASAVLGAPHAAAAPSSTDKDRARAATAQVIRSSGHNAQVRRPKLSQRNIDSAACLYGHGQITLQQYQK